MQKRKLRENCKTATLSYSTLSDSRLQLLSAPLAPLATSSCSRYSTLCYSIDTTLLKYCACHAQPPSLRVWSAKKKHFVPDLLQFWYWSWKSTISCEEASATFRTFSTVSEFAQPWQCDSWKQHLRHVTNYCACHEIARCAKCSACNEKRHSSIETLLNIALVTQNANADKRQQKHAICDEVDLEHVIRITFSVHCSRVRPSALMANTLWTVAVVETTLGSHDSNFQTTRVKRGAFGNYK